MCRAAGSITFPPPGVYGQRFGQPRGDRRRRIQLRITRAALAERPGRGECAPTPGPVHSTRLVTGGSETSTFTAWRLSPVSGTAEKEPLDIDSSPDRPRAARTERGYLLRAARGNQFEMQARSSSNGQLDTAVPDLGGLSGVPISGDWVEGAELSQTCGFSTRTGADPGCRRRAPPGLQRGDELDRWRRPA